VEAEAASRQHGTHDDHAGGMEAGVSHAQHTTGRPEELQLDPLAELSFFSLSFPSHGPSPIFPCDFQQKLLATANHLQAYNYAEEYSC
jgi:hypothetical protein